MHPADLILLGLVGALALIFRRGLVSDGFGFDRAVAALLMRAKHGETMSFQFAAAQAEGKPWGCLGCRVLAIAVEPAHCTKTLAADGPPTAAIASYRAGALLLVLLALFVGAPWTIGRFF